MTLATPLIRFESRHPMRYQTEIHVSPDRYVCLQLPNFFPEGRAKVTVTVELDDTSRAEPPARDESDRQDVEWWEEFDDGRTRNA